MASFIADNIFYTSFIRNSPTLILSIILLCVVLVRLFIYYLNFRKIVKSIDKIPGPPVGNILTGHLEFFRQSSGRSDWFQRKY